MIQFEYDLRWSPLLFPSLECIIFGGHVTPWTYWLSTMFQLCILYKHDVWSSVNTDCTFVSMIRYFIVFRELHLWGHKLSWQGLPEHWSVGKASPSRDNTRNSFNQQNKVHSEVVIKSGSHISLLHNTSYPRWRVRTAFPVREHNIFIERILDDQVSLAVRQGRRGRLRINSNKIRKF